MARASNMVWFEAFGMFTEDYWLKRSGDSSEVGELGDSRHLRLLLYLLLSELVLQIDKFHSQEVMLNKGRASLGLSEAH